MFVWLSCYTNFLAAKKLQKAPAHGKNLRKCPLLTPQSAIPQSVTCSSLQASACFQGAAELDLHGYTRKVIPAQIFKQSSHNGLKTSGLALDFSTVPFRRWRGICLAMEYSANFTRTMVISKRNRHHQNHRQIPFCFWIKWSGLFDC